MKNLYAAFIFCLLISGVNAQLINNEVSTGPGYENQVWYSLENGEVASAPLNNWDLAFEITGFSASIRANCQKGMVVFNAPFAIDEWNEVDTIGMATEWGKLYNSEESWSVGAFNQYPTSESDLGWGIYNFITHHVNGDSIQVVQLANGDYKKLKIESLASSIYTFTYADLNGENEVTAELNKNDFTGKNFGYYSMETGEVLDREPLSEEWDMTFHKYMTNLGIMYPVSGVMTNAGATVSQVPETNIEEAEPGEFNAAINTIGYDWKSFDFTEGWILEEDLSYFVQLENGDTYQVVFTGFGGSGTGVYEMGLQFYGTLSLSEQDAVEFTLFPNPVSAGMLNIEGEFETNTKLEILDITGTLVWSSLSTGNMERVDISNLSNGTYIFRALTNASTSTKKFIVNK